jgi:hypothetical protein
MSGNIKNLILEHLRTISSDITEIKEIMRDQGRRLTALELSVGNLAAQR